MMSRGRLLVSEAFRSMGANLSTSIAAIMTVLIGMFLLGLSVALGTWVVSWSDHVKSQLQVKVYLENDVTKKQINSIATKLSALNTEGRIKETTFISREKALAIAKNRYPEYNGLLAYNPFPASFEVTPSDADDVQALSRDIRTTFAVKPCPAAGTVAAVSKLGVDCVKDGEQTSKRILQVGRAIEIVFIVTVLVLLISSVLLIANTIRLSIFSRRREIEVMKLVGATNWFVRGPFMLEGLFCGVVGSLGAIILLFIGKEVAVGSILGHVDTSTSNVQALAFGTTSLIMLGVGLAVGAIGSGLTMHRFLRV
jgi:cell division transport system permease protein